MQNDFFNIVVQVKNLCGNLWTICTFQFRQKTADIIGVQIRSVFVLSDFAIVSYYYKKKLQILET